MMCAITMMTSLAQTKMTGPTTATTMMKREMTVMKTRVMTMMRSDPIRMHGFSVVFCGCSVSSVGCNADCAGLCFLFAISKRRDLHSP